MVEERRYLRDILLRKTLFPLYSLWVQGDGLPKDAHKESSIPADGHKTAGLYLT